MTPVRGLHGTVVAPDSEERARDGHEAILARPRPGLSGLRGGSAPLDAPSLRGAPRPVRRGRRRARPARLPSRRDPARFSTRQRPARAPSSTAWRRRCRTGWRRAARGWVSWKIRRTAASRSTPSGKTRDHEPRISSRDLRKTSSTETRVRQSKISSRADGLHARPAREVFAVEPVRARALRPAPRRASRTEESQRRDALDPREVHQPGVVADDERRERDERERLAGSRGPGKIEKARAERLAERGEARRHGRRGKSHELTALRFEAPSHLDPALERPLLRLPAACGIQADERAGAVPPRACEPYARLAQQFLSRVRREDGRETPEAQGRGRIEVACERGQRRVPVEARPRARNEETCQEQGPAVPLQIQDGGNGSPPSAAAVRRIESPFGKRRWRVSSA